MLVAHRACRRECRASADSRLRFKGARPPEGPSLTGLIVRSDARGVKPEAFDGFDPSAYLPTASDGAAARSLDQLVAHNKKSAKTHSGIWRDLAIRKRHTEVDAQLGIVVELARETGVPTPLTARLVELIHDVEEGKRPQSLETLDALAAIAVDGWTGGPVDRVPQ